MLIQLGAIRVNPLGVKDWTYLIATKVWHVILRILIPHYVLGADWWTIFMYDFVTI